MVCTVTLAMAEWPASDKAMWEALIRPARGPLDERGALSHLRTTSQAALICGYERWLAWLMTTDPVCLRQRPERRGTPMRLAAWLESLSHLALRTRLTLLARTLRILSAAAPDADWSVHRHLIHSLDRRARKCGSPRKAGRILSSAVLLEAGRKLAGSMADAASTPLAVARMRRDGTMVAFLALLPMRRRALSELTLGQSVLLTPDRIFINLSGDMTKSGQPWEAQVPTSLAPQLRRYIEEVRPFLLRRGSALHDKLWVGEQGTALGYAAIGQQAASATLRMTGIRIPPHFFRDAAASTLARRSPGDARLIRPLLAHSSFGTAERHYIQAQGIETGRDYAAVLAQLTEGDD